MRINAVLLCMSRYCKLFGTLCPLRNSWRRRASGASAGVAIIHISELMGAAGGCFGATETGKPCALENLMETTKYRAKQRCEMFRNAMECTEFVNK